jgi:mannose-6-phosphate isomerase-like protein (cupin superfamily)
MDWALTITLAAVAGLVFQAEVAKPYRIPSSSMEPTLHCAKPARGCLSRVSDRVVANRLVYRFHEPRRGDIIVFKPPALVEAAWSAGGTFIKRIVGLPGDQPNGLYHSENQQEAFLVLSGEGRLLVEGEERLLRPWDFFHSPAGPSTSSWAPATGRA